MLSLLLLLAGGVFFPAAAGLSCAASWFLHCGQGRLAEVAGASDGPGIACPAGVYARVAAHCFEQAAAEIGSVAGCCRAESS